MAEFVGTMNMLPGRLAGPAALVGDVVVPVTEPATIGAAPPAAGGPDTDRVDTELGVRPEDVHLEALTGPARSAAGPGGTSGPAAVGVAPGARGLITREIPRGGATELVIDLGTVSVRALVSGDRDPARDYPGGHVAVRFGRVLVYRDGVLA